jgi:dUTPase
VTQGSPQETEELSDTERGEGGFGSTGGTSNHSKG